MTRVTNSMMHQTLLSDLHKNLARMLEQSHQLTTGKKHSRPSDNPIDVTRELGLNTSITENTQYRRNLDDAVTWLSNTDTSMNQMTDIVHRIRELAVYAGDGALSQTEMDAIAEEMVQLQEELINTANYSVEGRYLLAGLNTSVPPFKRDDLGRVIYTGNTEHVEFEVERGVVGQVSFHGREIFPQSGRDYSIQSRALPMDFRWEGRSEIIQIKVGDRVAKVRIPERWSDDQLPGIDQPTDENGFRDQGELKGYTLDQIADIINTSKDMGDISKLVTVRTVTDSASQVQHLEFVSHTGEPIQVTSWPETDTTETDHSHTGLVSLLGMETTLQSVEFPSDTLSLSGGALHWRLQSGDNKADLQIDASASLTVDELAERIRQVAGDWLEVVVQTDSAETSSTLDGETATKKLLLRPKDNEPLVIYDKAGTSSAQYAAQWGLSTAMTTEPGASVSFSTATTLDPNLPALMKVSVGDKDYTVKIYLEDVRSASGGNSVDSLKVLEQIVDQVGDDVLGMDILDSSTQYGALFSKTGEPVVLRDMNFSDPSFAAFSGGLALQMGVQTGLTGGSGATDDMITAGGTLRIATLGKKVDITIDAGSTPEDVARRIREAAGDWIDVSYYDPRPGESGSQIQFGLVAKDGSPLTVYDVQGTVASDIMNMDNAIKGTVDVSGWTPPANGTFSISINGMEHTIDLSAISPSEAGNPVTIEDLVHTINSRFQEQGVKAELVKDGADQRLVLWSPQGFSIEATQSGDDATALLGATSAQTENRGGIGAYSQKIAVRTGANQQKTDFFGVIENLANAVRQQDREGINSIMLGKIDDFTDNLLRCRTREGAVQKRYTSNQSRLQQNNLNLTELYSKVSDVDLAEAYTQHKMTEAIYQASLAMMAQIIQPTLVDFLR